MQFSISTEQLKNTLKELIKIFIKNDSYKTHAVTNCVLIEADILGNVRFTCCLIGFAQLSILVENVDVINSGFCLVNLYMLSKKIKYLDEAYVELACRESREGEITLYIKTASIDGAIESPIFSIEEFPAQNISGVAICDIDSNVFNVWNKAIRTFCSGLETLNIRSADSYLEGCTFNSASHQTMMLYTRIATLEEYISDFVINIPAVTLNTLMTINDNNKVIQMQKGVVKGDDTDPEIIGFTYENATWWCWTNLASTAEQLTIAEFCSNQKAESTIEVNRSLLIKRLTHLEYQDSEGTTKKGLRMELVTNEEDELLLQLSMDKSRDKIRVHVNNYHGNWKTQRYDLNKLTDALKTLTMDRVIIQQFLTDENNPDSLDALSLRLSDLEEQSRIEIYIESLV